MPINNGQSARPSSPAIISTIIPTPIPLRIIGIDPGLRTTGFGIIDRYSNQDLRYVVSGTIKSQETELSKRLHEIFSGLVSIAKDYQPHCAAIEKVFVNVNPQSTLLLGQARGAALVALTQSMNQVHEYTALQLKQSLVGYGRASKEQVQDMVQRLLNLSKAPSSDAADALGMAITHAHSLSHLAQLKHIDAAHIGRRVKKGRSI